MSKKPKVFPGSLSHVMSECSRITRSKSKAPVEGSTNPKSLPPVSESSLAPPDGYSGVLPEEHLNQSFEKTVDPNYTHPINSQPKDQKMSTYDIKKYETLQSDVINLKDTLNGLDKTLDEKDKQIHDRDIQIHDRDKQLEYNQKHINDMEFQLQTYKDMLRNQNQPLNNNPIYNVHTNNNHNPAFNSNYNYYDNIDKLIKKFKRFETIKNPRQTLSFFKEEFHRLDINDDNTKYNILIERLSTIDVQNYYKLVYREERNYTTFSNYCENRDNHLAEVLGKPPKYDTSTPFSVYLADATKWAESNKHDLIKFFAFYLAPKSIKDKVKENFDESYEIFVKQIRRSWNNRQEEFSETYPVNFDNTQKPYQRKQKTNFHNGNNTQRINKNYNSNSKHVTNPYENRQNKNFNQPYNNMNNFEYNLKLPFCFNHQKYGHNAHTCRKPGECQWAELSNPSRPQGNSFPSSNQ